MCTSSKLSVFLMRFNKRFQLLELVLTTFSVGAAKAQGSKVKAQPQAQAQGGGASAVDKPQEDSKTEADDENRVDSKTEGE